MNAPPDNTTPAVEVTHLRKVYGSGHTEVVAIRDVSMQVARGEIVGMLGPSGAGKSTLLTAIALINPPTTGQITIGGKPVLDGPRALVDLRAFRRQNLGFVFQKANLIPFLTALENVQIALEINDTAPQAARQARAGAARLPRRRPARPQSPRSALRRRTTARRRRPRPGQ